MRHTRLWRLLPGAALILLSAGSSLAMTLGRAQGMTLIGRPLDVTVPVVLDAGSDPNELCPVAEVFYGESRIEAPGVSLRPTGVDTAVLRVQVPRPVDEAFVTVQVRVGCTQMLSRRFVLLTEEPGDTAQAAAQPTPVAPAVIAPPTALPVRPIEPAPATASAAASAAAASTPPAAAPAAAPALSPAAAPAAVPVRRDRPARAAAAQRPATSAKRPAPVARPATPAPAPPAVERPRLKLEAPELSAAATPGALKPATGLQEPAPGSADPAQRPEAAVQSEGMNTSTEDLLRSAERMVALEADMRAMREAMQKNQAMMAEWRSRLEQAEGERYANGLVYTLAALLAAACGLAGLFWQRSRRAAAASANWWADRSQLSGMSSQADAPVSEPQAGSPASSLGASAVAEPREEWAASPAAFPRAAGTGETRTAARDAAPEPGVALSDELELGFATSAAGELPAVAATPVNFDELSDLQQQAEFFVSLGEYERAIAALREHIDAQPQAATIAWLELLDLYHRLRREGDYEQLRRDYEWVFSDQLPAFADYANDTPGIEAQAETMLRIESLWGQPSVLEVIEQAVLRTPRREGEPAMGLEALRDLLMLHGVASELASTTAQPDSPAVPDALHAMRPAPISKEMPVAAASLAKPALSGSPVASAQEAGLGSFDLDALSLDPLPNDDWKKLAPPNSRPAGLDLNLDDLDQPPATDRTALVRHGRDQGSLLDFDLDLSEEFKLPKR